MTADTPAPLFSSIVERMVANDDVIKVLKK
jgi:hypothetical protein